jgi:hypothetical protein
MDAKAKRQIITDMLDELKADMMSAVEQMPEDWDETELGRYHRAEMLHRLGRRPGSLRRQKDLAPRSPAFPTAAM